jgi:lysophospholipase L1-like esterase
MQPRQKPATQPRFVIVIWLLQLILPTLGLAQWVVWVRTPQPIGRWNLWLLAPCLLWYAGCLLVVATRPGRRWIKARSKELMALFVSVTLCLVLAEMICRIATKPDQPQRHFQYSPELGWRPTPGAGDTGQDGWRKPFHAVKKAPGHFRIVCLGDSTTYGLRCSWEEAWPHRLETLINQDADWTKQHGTTEVINLGVPAYGPDQSLLVLKNYGLSYAPDVVIFHLCSNDFADVSTDHWLNVDGVTRYKPFYVLQEGRLAVGRDHAPLPRDAAGNVYDVADQDRGARSWGVPSSALLSFIRRRTDRLALALGKHVVPEQYWPLNDTCRAEYAAARPLVWALIVEMSSVCSEARVPFLVTLSPTSMSDAVDRPPWRVGSFVREYEDDARMAGVRAFSCVPEFFAEGGNKRFVLPGDPYHLNAQGNALIARTTLRWLKETL